MVPVLMERLRQVVVEEVIPGGKIWTILRTSQFSLLALWSLKMPRSLKNTCLQSG
jgi:hypothetical protein